MSGSSFRRAHLLLSQREHGFTEGSQQWRKGKHRISTCDTSVFVLQNAAGMAKWPIPAQFEADLRAAFVSKHETIAQRKARKEADAAEEAASGEEEDWQALDSEGGEGSEVDEANAGGPVGRASTPCRLQLLGAVSGLETRCQK